MVIVDTNIIVDFLRQRNRPDTLFQQLIKNVKKANLALSILSIQELYAGRSSIEPESKDFIEGLILSVKILPYTLDVAKKAGQISRELGGTFGFVDPAIAATAIVNGAQLATLNPKDFSGIEGLEIYKI